MYKLVVFDLDGTLANTLCDLANAVNKALLSENLPTHPTHSYNQFVGNGVNNLIKLALMDKADDKALFDRVKAYFDSYYPEHLCDYTVSYDGMSELLSTLESLDVMTAVHSNKPHIYVPQILRKLYPEHSFDIAWGQQECFERKPSAQALVEMMHRLGADSTNTLYVGDSDVDVITAHNAEVEVCGVEWGFRGKAELVTAGADYTAKDARELLSIIKGIV